MTLDERIEASARDCPRLGKLFRGCRFEPRYDAAPTMKNISNALPSEVPPIIKASMRLTYVGDVCVRCGWTISRDAHLNREGK